MKTKYKILLGCLGLAIVLGWFGYAQYTRTNEDLAFAKADIEITSSDLIKSFQANEKTANQRFLDKIVAVSGTVKEVSRDEKGYYTLILSDSNSAMSSVRCSMDTVHAQDLSPVRSGQQVTVKGACTGFNADELLGSDVILNRCVLKNN